jgi:hypothetical protein
MAMLNNDERKNVMNADARNDFIGAVMTYRMPYHKGNEGIREEIAISDIHMITEVSK